MNRPKLRSSKYFFTALILVSLFMAFVVAQPYLITIILAIITASIFRPLYERLLKFTRGREPVALIITLAIIFFVVFIPIAAVGTIIVGQLITFANDLQRLSTGDLYSFPILIEQANTVLGNLPGVDYQIDETEILARLQGLIQPAGAFLAQNLLSIGFSTFELFAKLIVFLTTLTAVIVRFPKLVRFLKDISPLPDEIDDLYINRVLSLSKNMISGIFIIAIIDGIAVGLLLAVAGVEYALFWGLLAVFFSIIPVGAGVVPIPIGIIYLLTGDVARGLFIILVFVIVINNIDNIIRPRLVGKEANLHPAITLVGILGGLELMGFFGIIIGPIAMIFLVTTFDVYRKHFSFDNETYEKAIAEK